MLNSVELEKSCMISGPELFFLFHFQLNILLRNKYFIKLENGYFEDKS